MVEQKRESEPTDGSSMRSARERRRVWDQPQERLKTLSGKWVEETLRETKRKRERQKGGKGKREKQTEKNMTAQRKHSAHRPARASNGNSNDSNSSRSTPTSMVRQSTPLCSSRTT